MAFPDGSQAPSPHTDKLHPGKHACPPVGTDALGASAHIVAAVQVPELDTADREKLPHDASFELTLM